MKKLTALLLVLVMVFSLAACSSNGTDSSTTSETTTSTSETTTDTTDSTTPAASTEEATVNEVATSTGSIALTDIMDTANIDTSRKSTFNSDERVPEVVISVSSEVTTWTPWQSGQGRSAFILTVFEPLFYYHDGYELEACIAKDWYDEDDTHMVVEIYDNVYDSDGNNLTASDIVAAYDYFNNSGNANDFNYFASCEEVDTYTVRFTWTAPIDSLTSLASILEVALYTQEAFNAHDFTTDPVGTGAYKLTELVTGSKYVLEPTDYWQTDDSARCQESMQNVDKLTIEVISETNVAYVAFEEGTLFTISPSSIQLADFLEGGKYAGEYTMVYELKTGTKGIGFNMSGESIVSDDINLRLAICYAIDSEGIVAAIGDNSFYVEKAEAGSTITGYNTAWDSLENYRTVYDVDLAKDYLSKSNYNGEELVILNQSGNDSAMTATQIIQQELSAIGINTRIDNYEHAIINTYLYDVTCWDIFFYNWAGDPISQLWARQSDINNYNHGYTQTGINDPVLQEMIERVQTKSGFTDELIDEIEAYFTDNCLLYSIFGEITWTAYDSSIASLCTNHGHKDIVWTACNYYLD
jgi:ABC-type transport system substrate-binding protein